MAKTPLFLAYLLVISACAGERKKEALVPEETQDRSEDLYGQQSQTMGSLNQTPAEQAAARHDSATRPTQRSDEPPGESRER